MRKLILSAIIAAAFLAGTFFTAFSIADATNGDNAWAKLVARVTALEEKPANNMKIVILNNDDEAGHAAGWDPGNGQGVVYRIIDADVEPNSIIHATIDYAGDIGLPLAFTQKCAVDVLDA